MVTTAMADGRPPDRFIPFDFSEEDCRVETDGAKKLSKITNLESDLSPITRYNFFQCYLPEDQVQGNDFGECVIDSPVIVSPDFIIYEDEYSIKSRLTFSCSFIEVEGSYPFGPKRPFSFKWAADDIINIEWQWCEMIQTARVSIHFKLKADDKAADSSDVAELTFSVSDPNWLEKQKAIKSLNVRYRTGWNLDFNNDTDRRPGVSSDDNSSSK